MKGKGKVGQYFSLSVSSQFSAVSCQKDCQEIVTEYRETDG